MARRIVFLVVLALGLAMAAGAMAQSATGEATFDAYAKAWRVAMASLGATASVTVNATGDAADRAAALRRLAEYQAVLNDAVVALVRLRPPLDETAMRMHFALLPLFQEATAASGAWLDGAQTGDDDEARLAEEWFWSVITRIRARVRAFET